MKAFQRTETRFNRGAWLTLLLAMFIGLAAFALFSGDSPGSLLEHFGASGLTSPGPFHLYAINRVGVKKDER